MKNLLSFWVQNGESVRTRVVGIAMELTRVSLPTSSGSLEDLHVPRDREGRFQTQAFERYGRDVPQVAQGLTQMFVAGVSTEKVGEVAQTLMGVAPSASAVSRLNQTLTEQFEAWRERSLQSHYRVIYLDGVHFTVRHGEKTDATIILTALGVDLPTRCATR